VISKLHAPEGIPLAQRFDVERLASDLRGRGTAARVIPEIDGIVAHVVERVHPGDAVVIFSSGEFGGIHKKLLETLGDPILPARPEDMARVREILGEAGLGGKDLVDDRFADTTIIMEDGKIAGTVTVEIYDEAAIFRSLAILPEHRGHGLGWLLADHAVARAREKGARRLYLLTETASDFFAEKFGFRAIDRSTVDTQVAASPHFRDSARSAVAMRLDL
jgi:N-acetylglutamate synthase-like GNAT family acetyltransferase